MGVIALVVIVSALVVYLGYEHKSNHVELERLRGNEYRACLAIKAGSGGYFYERLDGRFVWNRI